MFDVLVESTSQRRGAKMWAYFAASSVVWLGIFAVTAIAGVMTYDARLDAEFDDIGLTAYLPEAAPPKAPAPTHQPETSSREPDQFVSQREAPATIAPPRPVPPSTSATTSGLPGGSDHGMDGGVPGTDGSLPPGMLGAPGTGTAPRVVDPPHAVQPDPPQPPKAPDKPISGGVITGLAVKKIVPPYPPMAERVGVTGTVVVEVLVSEQGSVLSARAVSGHPLLRDAAERAARGWKFSPTKLSNVPVKVIGTITFTFKKP